MTENKLTSSLGQKTGDERDKQYRKTNQVNSHKSVPPSGHCHLVVNLLQHGCLSQHSLSNMYEDVNKESKDNNSET